jgi:VanZ family protein
MLHRWKWLALAAICLASFFIPFRFEDDAEFYIRLMDAVHLPGFFALTMFAHRFWPWEAQSCRRRIRAALAVAVFCAAVEIIQPLTGRSASLVDLLNGIAGILLAFILLASADSVRRTTTRIVFIPVAVACVAAAFLPAWRESAGMRWRAANFPLLADFENDNELLLWPQSGEETTLARVPEHAANGRHSLRVSTAAGATWPGVRLLAGGRDWSAYQSLALEIWNDGPAFALTLRVDDDFYRDLQLAPGWNHIRIPLSEIAASPSARRLNLRAIRNAALFIDAPKAAHTFHIDHVRLE